MNIAEYVREAKVAEPTLRSIAEVLGAPAQRIYSVAKQPIAGEVYDARKYNWDAITKFVVKRLNPEKPEIASIEAVVDSALALDKEYEAKDGRRGSRTGTPKQTIKVGDKEIPGRRIEMALGQKFVSKKAENVVLEVVYLTPSHACFKNENGELSSMSNWTINQQIRAYVSEASTETEAPKAKKVTVED